MGGILKGAQAHEHRNHIKKMAMDKLMLTKELIELPVTDLRHVIEEINKHRMAQKAIRAYFKEMAMYQRERKKKNSI